MVPGPLADVAVLSADDCAMPKEEIARLASVLTIVGGTVIYATDAFAPLAPPPLPLSPDWGVYLQRADNSDGLVPGSHSIIVL
jgi:hypothetical protein